MALLAVASAPSYATATAKQPVAGLYVSGHGLAFKARFSKSAIAVDSDGDDHLLIDAGDRARIVYAVRVAGGRHWHTQHFSQLNQNRFEAENNLTSVNEVASVNGRTVDAIVNDCKGLYTASGKARSTRLPSLHRALKEPKAVCSHDGGSDGGPDERYRVGGAVALTHNRVELLIDDLDAKKSHLYVGQAGHKLSLVSHSELEGGATKLVRDTSTGELFAVAGSGSSGVAVSSKAPGKPWRDPVTVASDPSEESLSADSLAASGGKVWLAIGEVGDTTSQVGTELLATRDAHGHWATPVEFPRTKAGDQAYLLLANPATGTVHATYLRLGAQTGGIFKTALGRGDRSAPRAVVRGEGVGEESLALSPKGTLVVDYQSI